MLLPSPPTSDANGAGAHGAGGPDLRTALAEHLMPTPTSRDWKDGPPCANVPDNSLLGRVIHNLLPTPAVNDMGAMLPTPTTEPDTGNGHARNLGREALLPTTTADASSSGAADYTTGHAGTTLTDATVRQPSRWGKYAAAIARWETVTRPAPEPTNITAGYLKARAKRLARLDRRPVGMRGSLKPRRQLAARFSEWMMGVPLGWIADTPSITRNEALKAAGNGVVPQQAAEALRFLLTQPTGRQIADAHEPDDLLELLAVDA